MKAKNILLTIASLLFTGGAIAQINESDTVRFQSRVSVTGNYQTGNVQVLTIKNKLDFVYAPVRNFVFKSQNNSLYQSFYDKKADNDLFSRNYFYFKPENKIYPFAIGYVSSNFRRKIDFRYFVGAGITYQLLNKKIHVIKISASAVYEQTNFKGNVFNSDEYNGASQIKLWRGTAYIGGWSYLFEKRLRLFYDGYWQPAFNNKANYRGQFDVGADFPVWKGLSFNALYTFTHENVTILKIKTDDRILTFGLSYNLRLNYN